MLNKKCFVLDLDGTVYLGDIPIQETVDFILRHWDTIDFHFLSNNTSKAPTTYVNKLTRMGIPATLDRILSPVTPLIAHLRANGMPHRWLPWGTVTSWRACASVCRN